MCAQFKEAAEIVVQKSILRGAFQKMSFAAQEKIKFRTEIEQYEPIRLARMLLVYNSIVYQQEASK